MNIGLLIWSILVVITVIAMDLIMLYDTVCDYVCDQLAMCTYFGEYE